MGKAALTFLLLLMLASGVAAKEPADLQATPLAQAFGSAAELWGARLSPDGSKISFIHMHEQGVTVLLILDAPTGKITLALAGERDRYDVSWCDWANEERLLCGLRAIMIEGSIAYPATRLVAVAADGSESKVLLARRLQYTFAQEQDNVIDWLPDDREHVLVEVPTDYGAAVGRLNIYDGSVKIEEREQADARGWISDGHGVARLVYSVGQFQRRWRVRDDADPEASWSLLRETPIENITDTFSPIGFAERRDELLFFDEHEGRNALFALELQNDRQRRLLFAHPAVDVSTVYSLGKYRRLVAASYITDRPHLEFFDRRIEEIHGRVSRRFPGKLVTVVDEDWSQRYYLVYVSSDQDPGTYYRLDTEKSTLGIISPAYPALKDRELLPMKAIQYAAKDGTQIPAYITLPAGAASGPRPAIVLPHGGPSSRDYWSYDFLVQFLAASGYVVLQSNYRGSDGYGAEWRGAGGFQNWRIAVSDITDGAEYLVREGIADPERICVVGWSYGGYAALLSSIEEPERYRCVVSIAGVTDPIALGQSSRNYVGGRAAQLFIGTDDEVRKAGSPMERASELAAPVLLFHAEKDLNVPFSQSKDFYRALTRADRPVELIEYEFAEHDIEPERYRIDLLARLGAFLDSHLRVE